jgi:hypothetical protein
LAVHAELVCASSTSSAAADWLQRIEKRRIRRAHDAAVRPDPELGDARAAWPADGLSILRVSLSFHDFLGSREPVERE